MTKSKWLHKLLRTLIMLLGAGVGAALVLLGVEIHGMTQPDASIPLGVLIFTYIGACALFMLVFYFLSSIIIERCIRMFVAIEKYMDKMTFGQVTACTIGLVMGLVIAMLVSQLIHFLGTGVFTTALSAIMYVMLGLLGWTIGWKRGKDVSGYFGRMGEKWERRSQRRQASAAQEACCPKLIDASVLIDGRLPDVYRTGFIEGELVVPQFIVDELRQIADSADPARRARGRRGLDNVKMMQEAKDVALRIDDSFDGEMGDADVKLIRMAQQMNAAVITGDSNLCKVGAVTGVRMLNLHMLASALKTKLSAGDEMTVQVVREGREPGQGVAYHEDGTMIVIEQGQKSVGQTVTVTVTSVLQTSAGRMIFAKPTV